MRRAIFISYRRSDSLPEVERIYIGLRATFSMTEIFRDVQSVPLGSTFPAQLQKALLSPRSGWS